MKMHNYAYGLAAIMLAIFALFLPGCGTAEGSRRSTGNWILDWEADMVKGRPENEIAFMDNPDSMPRPAESGLFYRINWFNPILGTFELHQKLNMEQKQRLFDALFGHIPGEIHDRAYRMVSVGNFMNGKSLIFALAAVKLNEHAPPGSSLGIQILSNCLFTDVKKKNEDTVTRSFVITELSLVQANWRALGVFFPDGRLVRTSDLFNEEKIARWKKESGNDQGLLAVNLSDLYIKDELESNDREAAAMLEKTIADANVEPVIAAAARLNYFLYLLAAGDTAGAEKMLNEAAALAKNSKEKDPGLTNALEYEAPAMLELYKYALRLEG